jgi:ankyrin repeat protein
MAAIELNDADLFSSLLARGANPNSQAPGGMTALILAAALPSTYVKRLIEVGANVNARNSAGQTPLMEAVRAGKVENVNLLVAAGAVVDAVGSNGKKPLRLAHELLESKVLSEETASQIIALLKRAGAKE